MLCFFVVQVTSSNSHVVVGIAILAVVLLISPVIIVLVRMVTRTLQVSAECHQEGPLWVSSHL